MMLLIPLSAAAAAATAAVAATAAAVCSGPASLEKPLFEKIEYESKHASTFVKFKIRFCFFEQSSSSGARDRAEDSRPSH